MKQLFTVFFFVIATSSTAKASDLKTDIERIKTNIRLGQMWGEDQAVRFGAGLLLSKGHTTQEIMSHPEFGKYWQAMDRRNTEELKKIVERWGWITISEFGAQADSQAWLLVQHADHDVRFQEKCLGLIENALKKNDSNPSNFAYLWDRVKVNQKKLQRFGTQGLCKGHHKWEALPMEEPTLVNLRRQKMDLGIMEDYIKLMDTQCPE